MPRRNDAPDENLRLYGEQPTTFNAFTGYPSTPLLDRPVTFRLETLQAMQRFKATNPWKREGPENSRTHKFNSLLKELRAIYQVPGVKANFRRIKPPMRDSGGSHYVPTRQLIVMEGRFSVVTFLHEFAHALGMDEVGAVRWSVNLFAQTFPEKMDNLVARGHMLVARDHACDGCIDRIEARRLRWTLADCMTCRRNPRLGDNYQEAEREVEEVVTTDGNQG